MPFPLPVHHVPSGFPSLATAGGQTARSGGPTAPRTEAGGQTASPGDPTTPLCSGSDRHPERSDRGSRALLASPSGSAEFSHLLGGTHDFGYAQHSTLDSTRATHSPSIYDYSHTTRGSGALPTSPSGSVESNRLPGSTHNFGYAQRGALDSTRATRGPSVYDHSRTTHGSGA
jgi:hypothetical protein